MSEDCPILPHQGKIHDRLSDHEVELAELREYMKSLDRSTDETKEAIKMIHVTLTKANELIHAGQLQAENHFAHMKMIDARFLKIDDEFEKTNQNIREMQGNLRNIATSLVLAFLVGAGAMVANYIIGLT